MWAGVLNAGCFQRIEFQEQEQMLPVPTKSTQRRFLPNKIKKTKDFNYYINGNVKQKYII